MSNVKSYYSGSRRYSPEIRCTHIHADNQRTPSTHETSSTTLVKDEVSANIIPSLLKTYLDKSITLNNFIAFEPCSKHYLFLGRYQRCRLG